MNIDEFIEKLREIRRKTNPSKEGFYYPTDTDFEKIAKYLRIMYDSDTFFKDLIDDVDRNKENIEWYLDSCNKTLSDNYGQVLVIEGLISSIIEKKDFNGLYKLFQEEYREHKKCPYEEYLQQNGISIEDADKYHYNPYIEHYKNWKNILENYYQHVMNGNFGGFINLYEMMHLRNQMKCTINTYYNNLEKGSRK